MGMIQNLPNMAMQSIMNRQQLRFAQKMYDRQRTDALSDWKMQNEYNAPNSQMERLKAAGLNPNLVYGNGADAQSNQAVRSSDAPTYRPEMQPFPQHHYGMDVDNYQDMRVKEAQYSNMQLQGDSLKADIAYKQTMTANALKEGSKRDIDLGYQEDFKQGMYAQLMENIKARKYQTDYLLQQYDLLSKTKATTVAKAWEELTAQRLRNTKTEAETKYIEQMTMTSEIQMRLDQLEKDLREAGGSFKDPLWQRKLVEIFNDLF